MIEAIIAFFMSKVGALVAAVGGGLGVLAGVYLKGRSAGVAIEKAKQAQAVIDILKDKDGADEAAASMPHDARVGWLRDHFIRK